MSQPACMNFTPLTTSATQRFAGIAPANQRSNTGTSGVCTTSNTMSFGRSKRVAPILRTTRPRSITLMSG